MHHYAKIFTIFVTAVFASEYNVEINDATQFKTMSNEDLLCMCNTQGVYTGYKMWKIYVFNFKSPKLSINIHIITIRNIQNSSSPSQLGVRRSKESFKVSHKNRIFNNFEGIFLDCIQPNNTVHAYYSLSRQPADK